MSKIMGRHLGSGAESTMEMMDGVDVLALAGQEPWEQQIEM